MRRFWWLPVLGLLAALAAPTAASSPQQTALDDSYGFRTFWESNGGERIFGAPVTGVIDENGRKVQYFERARLEYADSSQQVQLGLLGRERTKWQQFAPPVASPATALRFDSTPYAIAQPFRSFWEESDGLALFGLPISDAFWEHTAQGRFQVQYFERGQLIHHPLYAGTDQEFEIAPLGREIAAARGYVEGLSASQAPVMFAYDPVPPAPVVDETPVEEAAQVEVAAAPADEPPARPAPPPPAKPAPAAAPPSQGNAKQVIIDISDQWLYAYQSGEQVFTAPVATGKDGFNTPTGSFSVYAKVPLQTMRGSLNGETWVVPNVPHAMYFNGSVALHGTYWHNLFGSGVRISHGCVNLPLDAAAWLYDWARVGTSVTVRP